MDSVLELACRRDIERAKPGFLFLNLRRVEALLKRRLITRIRMLFDAPRFFAILAALLLALTASHATDLNTISGLRVQDGFVTVAFADNPGVYYLLEHSPDLINWGPADMSLGINSVMDLDPLTTTEFFRAVPFSKFSPQDTDGDGIDDVYELTHSSMLDPLDPSDGSHLAPGGGGLTNYQVYLNLFGILSYKILQKEGREVSVFNHGSGAPFEAITREQSIFNFGSPSATVEANSREVSLYNGDAVPISNLTQRESREWSIFNFGSPISTVEATSREISLFNGQSIPTSDLVQRESREWSIYNFGGPSATHEAISREVSVLNFTEP